MHNESLIVGKLEEKGDLINEKSSDSKLKWLSDKKLENFSYRVVFEADNPKHNHAIYLTEWKEALKIRDFSIVSAIVDKTKNQQNISPKDFIKHFALLWKALHAYKFLKLIRVYSDQENHEQEESKKRMKTEEEKRMERERKRKELEDLRRLEEEMRNKERGKIDFLRNSFVLQDLNVQAVRDFTRHWLSIAKNIQSLYLKSKPGER